MTATAAAISLVESLFNSPIIVFGLCHLDGTSRKGVTGRKEVPAREQKENALEESSVILHPLSLLWLGLNELQERRGRGQWPTQASLCRGFHPLL